MAKKTIEDSTLTSIGNAIRSKTGKTALIPPLNMPSEILSISSGNDEKILEQLRGSFTENIGGDFAEKSIDELLGTYEENPDTAEGIIAPPIHNYENGELYQLRSDLFDTAQEVNRDYLYLDVDTINGSKTVIKEAVDNAKDIIIAILNEIENPETPYNDGNTFYELVEAAENLPTFNTQSIATAQDDYRLALDQAISNIITAYGLDIELVEGTWELSLENLATVCDALSAKGNSQDSAWVDIIKENIENDTTFNLTLRSLWSLGTASNPLKLPYFKTDKAVFTMDTNSHPSNVEELGFDCSNISYVNGYIFASSPYLKKVILTGLDKRSKSNTTSGNFIGFFGSVKSLEEFYTDRICVINYAQTSLQNFFYNCSKLHTIGGFNAEARQIDDNLGQIDFTAVTSTANMFYNCQALQNVRFTEGTLTIGLDLSASPVLSKASVLSALYSTAPIAEGATKPTIKFNAAIDDSDSDIQNAITYATNNGFIVSIGGHTHQ